MRPDYAHAGVEPPIDELLNDPITQAVMHYDGVTQEALAPLLPETSAIVAP